MGFFDKMFEKKECAICGTELGLLGKTKINEGYPVSYTHLDVYKRQVKTSASE